MTNVLSSPGALKFVVALGQQVPFAMEGEWSYEVQRYAEPEYRAPSQVGGVSFRLSHFTVSGHQTKLTIFCSEIVTFTLGNNEYFLTTDDYQVLRNQKQPSRDEGYFIVSMQIYRLRVWAAKLSGVTVEEIPIPTRSYAPDDEARSTMFQFEAWTYNLTWWGYGSDFTLCRWPTGGGKTIADTASIQYLEV